MEKSLKHRMRNGEPVVGCWINLFSNLATEIVGQAGYDFAMIDMEHGPGSLLDAIAAMQALGSSCIPCVRSPSNDPVWIKRILDAGAQGVMIPSVDDVPAAQAAVAACHYAPRGMRGMAASIVRASRFGADWREYVDRIEAEVLVMCQIETGHALDNVEEIAAVDGLDMLFIGPFDLSASLGFLGEPDHPKVREAIDRIESAAKSAGKLLGGISTPERSAEAMLEDGYDLILPDSDVALLGTAARASAANLRAAKEKS